ncbi:unnamed protein product, partial [Iphiclides podalirius]
MASRTAAPLLLLPSLFCLLSVVRLAAAACNNVTEFSTQLDTLLAEYDRETLPETKVLVEIGLNVRHATIDERASSVHMLADLILSWDDKRLSWNSSEWGCDSALVTAERLWLPDVVVVSAATWGAGSEAQRARLTSGGHVSWTSRLDLSAPVELHLEAWPRDLHTITFKFASREFDTDQMDLKLGDRQDVAAYASGGWALASVSRALEGWQRGRAEARLATWTLALRRRAPAHALATDALLAAVTLLMVAATAMRPADRAPLFACASFIAALWLVSALVRLPGSATAPRTVTAAGALCACGAAAALCAALVRQVASAKASRTASAPVRAFLAATTAAAALCRLAPEPTSDGERAAWASAAKVLDYVLTAIILLTLFIIVCISL